VFGLITVLFPGSILADSLEEDFRNPPLGNGPYVWWHWMGANYSKEGITKDLEAMKASGIGGATVFNISSMVGKAQLPTENLPWPDRTYRSPAYWEHLKHAAKEADRLGLELGIHNCPGYSTTGGPWIDEERNMQRLVWSETKVQGGQQVSQLLPVPEITPFKGWSSRGLPERKLTFYRDVVVLAVPADVQQIKLEEVVDLTEKMDSDGTLRWNAPKGDWLVCRLGHAPIGTGTHPVPDELLGKSLEADKLSAEQTIFHWNEVIEPMKKHLGPWLGKSVRHQLLDSYEAGRQNWTPGFREIFIERKGYDPAPWLVSFGLSSSVDRKRVKPQRIIESKDLTARFEWDYQDVINALFYENGWKPAAKMLHEAGMDLQFEPYGNAPFSQFDGAAIADVPMVEFWIDRPFKVNSRIISAAQAAGRRVVGAEAFTGFPQTCNWVEDPAMFKNYTDQAYASGVNRLVMHHWVHQPFESQYKPGMGMGWWGTHFNRHQTWFEPGKAYFKYASRCQTMMQHGEAVSDCLAVEESLLFNNRMQNTDSISTRAFLGDAEVVDGKIVLPSGRTYPLLVISGGHIMEPEVAEKIKRLVAEGATVLSLKPKRSPGLKNYPECDADLQRIADEVWGSGKENHYGKGFVSTDLNIDARLKAMGILPDFQVFPASEKDVKIYHRNDGEADIYFIANSAKARKEVTVRLRVSGKQPELWQAEDGSTAPVAIWHEEGGLTEIPLKLNSEESVFIVFRKPAPTQDHPASIQIAEGTKPSESLQLVGTEGGGMEVRASDPVEGSIVYASGKKAAFKLTPDESDEVDGEWNVSFAPGMDAPEKITFPELVAWNKHKLPAINYFSGTAVYTKSIEVDGKKLKGRRVVLDLGEMHDIAEVIVNDVNVGVLWYPPFRADITEALKSGKNQLEIKVTNTWPNRLIGDEQEPVDSEWGKDMGDAGRPVKAYPDWFINGEERPSKGRKCFVLWSYFRKDSPLYPAGLIGPVRLVSEDTQAFPVCK
jgi:hypothetical protein